MEQSLDRAIGDAFDAAGVKRGPVAAACLGLAGADRPADQQMLLDWSTTSHLASRVSIENDGRLVVAAGSPDDWGMAVIAGTGSFALARTPAGQTRRAGGWGYLFGDEGSGYAIALAGLRAVTRAYDGAGPDTSLTERMLHRLHVDDVKSIVPAVYGRGLDRAEIARLAEAVTFAAEAGDAIALLCLENAADELAMTALAAAKLLIDESRVEIPLAFAGSLLTSCRLYADCVVRRLRCKLQADLSTVTFVLEPATGAVRLARKLLG
jgi:N-acetylglucosamine kinase-like BadF-type ATPase